MARNVWEASTRSTTVLTLGFGSIVALLVALILVWRTNVETINQHMEEIVHLHSQKTELLTTMRDAARNRAISLLRMAILEDPFDRDEEFMRFHLQAGEFIEARLQLQQLPFDPLEQEAWEKARELIQKGQAAQEKTLSLFADNKRAEANQVLLHEVIPWQNKVMEQLTVNLDLQRRATQATVEDARSTYRDTLSVILFLGPLAVSLSIGIALLVIKRARAAESALVLAKEEAQKANMHKSQFLAKMSHELRTPLNAILGYSELLEEDAKDKGNHSGMADLNKIHTAGHHLLELIDDILDLSKIEAGRLELYYSRFQVAEVIRTIVSTVEPLVKKNGNFLHVYYDRHLGDMEADETRVRQCLFNLLSNACKFTEAGQITLEANRLADRSGQNMVRFKVSDSGIGMTPDQVNQLFQAFKQADPTISRRYGGTGLGLAITRHFCEMMEGKIEVESEVGKGTTFTITLPAERG